MIEAKRLSPEELERHISDLEKSLENARKEQAEDAARMSEAAHAIHQLTVENAAIRAELARLKPSGQVAEDEEALRRLLEEMRSHMLFEGWREAMASHLPRLQRLAAKAQGYEAFAAACREALGPHRSIGTPADVALLHKDLEASRAFSVQFGNERDEATRIAVEAVRDRVAAVADNAALLRNALAIINHFTHPDRGAGQWTPDLSRMAAEISAWPHPGAALLEQLTQAATLLHQRPGETLPDAIRRAYADHDKALVRARNEGLERAANELEEIDGGYFGLAEKVRAMKDPEQ